MGSIQRRVDEVRRRHSAIENNLIDTYAAGRMDRREFIRRGTVVGMSLSTLGFLATACGANSGDEAATSTTASSTGPGSGVQPGQPKKGGTIRVSAQAPTAAVEPATVSDTGGIAMLGQTGEYLIWSAGDATLRPTLAERWEPLNGGNTWRFTLRQGVKFHDGQILNARDVVSTFDRLADPASKSNALSAFKGVLSKGNTKAVDDRTVEFNLDGPNGNFPNLVSSDNYNAIILPASYSGNWESSFIGTGPFRLDSYAPKARASFVPNPDYWGPKANPDRTEFTFYASEQPQVVGLQGGQLDVVEQFSPSGGKPLLSDPNVSVIELRSAAHRQIHMRTDQEPFRDKRVRQAMALALNRVALVDGLFGGKAEPGNDSPFAPAFPSTDTSVPQRQRDLAKARQLLADAGKTGLTVQVNVLRELEIPDLAQLLQNDAKEAGITLNLVTQDGSTYYGEAVFGQSPWLDSTMGITDYGHRGVPNVYLNAPLVSTGTWNAAHFKNPQYDQLVKDYTAAIEPDAQKRTARKIQELLLEEVPIIFPYFYNTLCATVKTLAGAELTAMPHLNLARAGFTV